MSEHIEAMAQYIEEVKALAVRAERERIAALVEEYRDHTPFTRLADAIRAGEGDD